MDDYLKSVKINILHCQENPYASVFTLKKYNFKGNLQLKNPFTLPRSESEKVQLDNTVSSEDKFSKFSEV